MLWGAESEIRYVEAPIQDKTRYQQIGDDIPEIGIAPLFKLLRCYLEQLGITEADQVLFVADGARWIWNRIAALVHGLGLKPEQVYELIDFYHAVEHLGKVAGLRKGWTARQRKFWVRKYRRLLKQGQVDKVIDAVVL